jgi:hypothetical protein
MTRGAPFEQTGNWGREGPYRPSLSKHFCKFATLPSILRISSWPFKTMIDEGAGLEDVAARFGITVRTVQQRLKLANVSPRLIALYRQGGSPR